MEDGERPQILVGVKGLRLCYFPGPLGSEVWHPICKQAARAEKKLKVSKLVVIPNQLLLATGWGHCALLESHSLVCTLSNVCLYPWISLIVTSTSMGFLKGLRRWM